MREYKQMGGYKQEKKKRKENNVTYNHVMFINNDS